MALKVKWIENFCEQEVPTGVVNGTNRNFSLSHEPHHPKTIQLYMDGLILRQGIDYFPTVSGGLILNEAPIAGQRLYAVYIKR